MTRARMMSRVNRAAIALFVMTGVATGPAWAQSSAATPSTTQPATTAPAPAPAPAAPTTGMGTPDKSPPDTSISQTLDLPARPAVILTGKATWDNGFKTIQDSFARLNDALAKNNITATSHPLAVFTETDDNGFSFSAEIPLDKAPEGKTELTPDIKIGETPSGKAMRFQHRGSYDEIDATYEAITAYLDEKGLEARNMFAEEYLDTVKTSDDSALEVDIYVFLK